MLYQPIKFLRVRLSLIFKEQENTAQQKCDISLNVLASGTIYLYSPDCKFIRRLEDRTPKSFPLLSYCSLWNLFFQIRFNLFALKKVQHVCRMTFGTGSRRVSKCSRRYGSKIAIIKTGNKKYLDF